MDEETTFRNHVITKDIVNDISQMSKMLASKAVMKITITDQYYMSVKSPFKIKERQLENMENPAIIGVKCKSVKNGIDCVFTIYTFNTNHELVKVMFNTSCRVMSDAKVLKTEMLSAIAKVINNAISASKLYDDIPSNIQVPEEYNKFCKAISDQPERRQYPSKWTVPPKKPMAKIIRITDSMRQRFLNVKYLKY